MSEKRPAEDEPEVAKKLKTDEEDVEDEEDLGEEEGEEEEEHHLMVAKIPHQSKTSWIAHTAP